MPSPLKGERVKLTEYRGSIVHACEGANSTLAFLSAVLDAHARADAHGDEATFATAVCGSRFPFCLEMLI